jgi:hypothetical protein
MSERHTTHFEESKNICALKIRNAKKDDTGVYTLFIQNPYGSDESTAQVLVIVPDMRPVQQMAPQMPQSVINELPKMAPTPANETKPPKFVKHLQPETTLNEGNSLILNGMIESALPPQVRNFLFNLNNNKTELYKLDLFR